MLQRRRTAAGNRLNKPAIRTKPALPAEGLTRADWITLGTAMVLAAALCLYNLGGRSIWIDEAVSLRIARTPGWAVLMSDGGNMAVYYALLRAWSRLGDGLEVIRLPSALFSAVGVGLIYLLARRLFDRRIATTAALLSGVNSSLVYYGQEARSYAMVLTLTVAGWLALSHGLERRTMRWFLLWGLLGGLTIGSHLFSVLMVGAQLTSLLLLPRRDLPWRGLAAGAALMSAVAAPFLLAAAGRGPVQIGWIPRTSLSAFRQVLWFLGGNNFEPTTAWLPAVVGAAVLIVCMAAWPLGAWPSIRMLREHGRSIKAWRYGVPVVWLLVPLIGGVAASLIVQPVLVPRFFIGALPAASMLVALAVSQLRQRWHRLAAIAVLTGLGLFGVLRSYATGDWQWDRAAAYLMQAAEPGDAVVVLPAHQRLSADYHLPGRPQTRSVQIISPVTRQWRPPPPTVYGVSDAFFEPAPPEEAARKAAGHERFWVLTSDYTRWDAAGRIRESWGQAGRFFGSLDGAFRVSSGRGYGRVGVLLLERAGDVPAG